MHVKRCEEALGHERIQRVVTDPLQQEPQQGAAGVVGPALSGLMGKRQPSRRGEERVPVQGARCWTLLQLGDERLGERAVEVGGEPERSAKGEQVMEGHRSACGLRLRERSARLPQHTLPGQLGQPAVDRRIERDAAVGHEGEREGGGQRLAEGVPVEQHVRGHRGPGLQVLHADSHQVGAASPPSQRHRARQVAGLDLVMEQSAHCIHAGSVSRGARSRNRGGRPSARTPIITTRPCRRPPTRHLRASNKPDPPLYRTSVMR